MRAWLLLPLLVPLVASADVSTPGKSAGRSSEPPVLEYVGPAEGAPEAQWHFSEYKRGDTVFRLPASGALGVVKVLEPAIVDGRHDRYYLVAVPDPDYGELRVFGGDLTPFEFQISPALVTVAFGADFKIHVRSLHRGELVLEPAGQGYLSRRGGNVTAELVEHVAPVPLIKVGSHPEACADFWDIYVSVVDGVPRQALALYGVADPPAMSTPTVKFDARAGTAVVTTRTVEDDKSPARIKRTRYHFDGRVFVDVSKRAATRSK